MNEVDLVVQRYDEWINNKDFPFDKLVISPGPGHAKEYQELINFLRNNKHSKPVFGICLGMQMIGSAFDAELINLGDVWHGVVKTTQIKNHHFLFHELQDEIQTGHYHSWVINPATIPNDIEIIANEKETGAIMAIAHKKLPIFGVQFHPESVMTPAGFQIIRNFINIQ